MNTLINNLKLLAEYHRQRKNHFIGWEDDIQAGNHAEYERIALHAIEELSKPSFLDQALNEGDGTYKP